MDNRLFLMLNLAQRNLTKLSDRYLRKHLGISTTQLAVLFFLYKNDGFLLKDLSRGLGLNNSAITGLIDRMEKTGIVQRQPVIKDGRAFNVIATEKGRELARKGLQLVNEFNTAVGKNFSREELDVILRFLNGAAGIQYSDFESATLSEKETP